MSEMSSISNRVPRRSAAANTDDGEHSSGSRPASKSDRRVDRYVARLQRHLTFLRHGHGGALQPEKVGRERAGWDVGDKQLPAARSVILRHAGCQAARAARNSGSSSDWSPGYLPGRRPIRLLTPRIPALFGRISRAQSLAIFGIQDGSLHQTGRSDSSHAAT